MAESIDACPECEAKPPPTARFCPQCGARLVSAPVAGGERRPVAVLFADLAGFTRLTSEMDAEDVHRLLGRFFDVVDGIVARSGGAVDKHIGDATMAVFGAPVAHGNDVERAVRAACDIHAAMASLSAEFDRPLATHVGIANGEVVAASVGSAVRADYTVTGDAVNLASRLEELAGEGETIVSDDVRRALGERLDAESRGTIDVRGFAQPMAVWRVRDLRAHAAPRHRLVGRERERAQFDALLAVARTSGVGATMIVRGDAGIGKSRLAEALLEAAAGAGFACHAARVLDFGAAQGREAPNLLARSLLGLGASDGDDACRAALDAAIAGGRARPDDEPFLADLLGIAQRPGSRYEAMDHAARARGRHGALASLAAAAARGRGCMLLVEDVHWATPAVVDALTALSERVREAPLIVVMTTRPEGSALAALARHAEVRTVELAPLSGEESLELARGFLAANPDVARRCVERAQGNPLFLSQLLQSGADGATVPATIGSVVLARLDRLPAAEKLAVQAASIAGQQFELALVAHLLGGATSLNDARARDLVRATGVDGQLVFAHALIRDAAYASLLHSAKRALHRRAADWYATRDAVLRAGHLDRADDAGAPQAYLEAARAELASLHPDTALSLARRGAALARDGAVAYALAMLAGDIARDLGHADVALASFEHAVERAGDDRERCAAHIGVASAHRLTTSIERGFAALDAATPLAQACGLVGERARIAYLRGSLEFVSGALQRCAASHEEALVHARSVGDERCEAHALSGLADVAYASGRLRSAQRAFERCVALAERGGDLRFTLMNRNMAGLIRFYLGRLPDALDLLQRTLALSREIGHRVAEVMADECVGLVLVGAGRDAEAVEPLERSLALGREIGSRRFAAIDLAMLGIAARRAGDVAAARERLDESWAMLVDIGPRFAGPLVIAAQARVASSDARRRELLAQGEAMLAEGSLSHNHLWYRDGAIDCALETGELDEALRHAGELERFAAPEPTPWSDFVVARARALVDAARGRPDAEALQALVRRAGALDLRAARPALDRALAAATR